MAISRRLLFSGFVFLSVLFVVPVVWAASSNEPWGEDQASAAIAGDETCAACHEDVVQRYQLSTHHATLSNAGTGKEAETCESCHGPGSLHADSAGEKKLITRNSPEACFRCHADKRAQFNLQFHHPVTEGRMSCVDCHDVHGKTSDLTGRTALARPNEKCFNCHKEFKGPYVFEHDPMREGCQVCHEPHGGVHEKLLVADGTSLCMRCHWEQSINTAGGHFGGIEHGADDADGNYPIGQGQECVDHHRSVHGSNTWRTFNR